MDDMKQRLPQEDVAQRLEEVVGNGLGRVSRTCVLGISKEVSKNYWLKAEVGAVADICCDQSVLGMTEASEIAADLARSWAQEELDSALQYLQTLQQEVQ